MSQNEVRQKTWTVGDRRQSIKDTLTDADGVAISLTSHTVAFRMTADITDTVKVNNASATIDDATLGYVSYAFTAADVDTAGIYWYWWIVTRTSDSKVEHFPGDGKKSKLVITSVP